MAEQNGMCFFPYTKSLDIALIFNHTQKMWNHLIDAFFLQFIDTLWNPETKITESLQSLALLCYPLQHWMCSEQKNCRRYSLKISFCFGHQWQNKIWPLIFPFSFFFYLFICHLRKQMFACNSLLYLQNIKLICSLLYYNFFQTGALGKGFRLPY